jgi:cupin fold WbuC family metalloprotein
MDFERGTTLSPDVSRPEGVLKEVGMTGVRNTSQDVFVALGSVIQITAEDLAPIVSRGMNSPRKRARLCAHPDPIDPLHEMLICLVRGTYVRPHRHARKSESFHLIDGELEVVLFDDAGGVRQVVRLGSYHSGKAFYYRLAEPLFHTVVVRTPFVLFHETTNGPFDRTDSEFAPWAPADDHPGREQYLTILEENLRTVAGETA